MLFVVRYKKTRLFHVCCLYAEDVCVLFMNLVGVWWWSVWWLCMICDSFISCCCTMHREYSTLFPSVMWSWCVATSCNTSSHPNMWVGWWLVGGSVSLLLVCYVSSFQMWSYLIWSWNVCLLLLLFCVPSMKRCGDLGLTWISCIMLMEPWWLGRELLGNECDDVCHCFGPKTSHRAALHQHFKGCCRVETVSAHPP